jgi:hypothetical protein
LGYLFEAPTSVDRRARLPEALAVGCSWIIKISIPRISLIWQEAEEKLRF